MSCDDCENSANDAERFRKVLLFFKGRFEYAGVNEVVAKLYAKTLEFVIEEGMTWDEAFNKLDSLIEGEDETKEM